MRSLVVLLLMVLFFMAGMVVGMDKDKESAVNRAPEENVVQQQKQSQIEMQTEVPASEPVMAKSQPNSFVQKTASFLESVVKGFYDIVVQILYQMVQMFF